MENCCGPPMEDGDISDPTASLISLLIIVFMSVMFGIVIGVGFALAIQLNTLDKQMEGTWILVAGFFGAMITGFVVVIRSERYRAKKEATQLF
jgi:hypothetical protein